MNSEKPASASIDPANLTKPDVDLNKGGAAASTTLGN
jgi:hypothetical protein